MRLLRPLRRLGRVLAPVLLAASGCTPRQEPPRQPPSPPVRQAPAAGTPPGPAADAERDAVLFTHWRSSHAAAVAAFEEFLVREQVAQVVPSYQLLRSASMWKECQAEPFALPPAQQWPQVRDLLVLLRELRSKHVLTSFEVVSAYRDPQLNHCAGGAPRSSHLVFAVDLAPLAPEEGEQLCRFWREQGQAWDMGVSRYPSGRIHIDRTGWRTWGATHRRGSSYCVD